jgi:PIN domain nuclease of toxin-antitoxin system
VWAVAVPELLSGDVRRLIQIGNNSVFFSSISIFEIAAKRASGRRSAPRVDAGRVVELAQESRLRELPVSVAHAAAVETLAITHPDPFDRLLLAQAQVEDLRLVTHDANLASYDSRAILF